MIRTHLWDSFKVFAPNFFSPPALTAIGPRNCLGQHLALIEARVVLSLLAQRFTFVPRDSS